MTDINSAYKPRTGCPETKQACPTLDPASAAVGQPNMPLNSMIGSLFTRKPVDSVKPTDSVEPNEAGTHSPEQSQFIEAIRQRHQATADASSRRSSLSSGNPAPVRASEDYMFSVDSEGFQMVLDLAGLRSTSTASAASRAFAEAATRHAETTVPHFLSRFSPQEAISRHIGSGDEAIRKLCRASLRLLCAEPNDVRHLAGRVQDAANEVLQATSSDECKTLARLVRKGARATLQANIDAGKPKVPPDTPEQEQERRLAECQFHGQRVQLMAQSFGVYTDPLSGIDFVLDHEGCAAYAFKPFPADPQGLAALVRAWTMTQFHTGLSTTLKVNLGNATSTMQWLPNDLKGEHGNATPAGGADDSTPLLRPGLLMAAPSGFELYLDDGAAEGRFDAEFSARRLSGALNEPLPENNFARLAVSALCMGESASSLGQGLVGQVLVDWRGNTWILDPERYFAPTTPDHGTPSDRTPASPPQVAPETLKRFARESLRGSASALLHQLSDLNSKPYARERRLLNQALQEHGHDELKDFTSIGVSKEAIDRALAQIGVVSDWARYVSETELNAKSVAEKDRGDIPAVLTDARTLDALIGVVQRSAAEPRLAD